MANLVLLCDVDHGLVHEHDLVLTGDDAYAGVHPIDDTVGRRPPVALPPRDAGAEAPANGDHRPDTVLRRTARRHVLRRRGVDRRRARIVPGTVPGTPGPSPGGPRSGGPRGTRRIGRGLSAAPPLSARPLQPPTPPLPAAEESDRLDRILFPEGAPPRTASREATHDRLNMAWAIGVLMDNRELVRRLETERGLGG